jgi:hypothetical protein
LGFKVWEKGKVPCAFVGADYRWVAPSTVIAWAVFGLVALFACKLVIYSDMMGGLMSFGLGKVNYIPAVFFAYIQYRR